MKIICELITGSRLYGLDGPNSDIDYRGVFINTKPSHILGLDKQDVFKKEKEDLVYFEFVHFLKGLRKTNTQVLELIFAKNFLQISEEFQEVIKNKYKLIDSEKLFSSLMGYIHNEKRLATGERTGELGSKRKGQLDLYGFSPKNFSHLLRLAYCGKVFFETGDYPVDLKTHPRQRDLLLSIKTEPNKYSKDQLVELADKHVSDLRLSFDNRDKNFYFDLDFANDLCLKFYYPFLTKNKEEI